MSTGDPSAFQIVAFIVLSVQCAYGGGRIHQWYKRSMDRDRSFREGYNHGYHALFPLAARQTRAAARPSPGVPGGEDRHGPEPLRD